MMDLEKCFRNPYDTPQISIAELLGFAEDHLGKMVALSDGTSDHDELIALTDVAFTALWATVGCGLLPGMNCVSFVTVMIVPGGFSR